MECQHGAGTCYGYVLALVSMEGEIPNLDERMRSVKASSYVSLPNLESFFQISLQFQCNSLGLEFPTGLQMVIKFPIHARLPPNRYERATGRFPMNLDLEGSSTPHIALTLGKEHTSEGRERLLLRGSLPTLPWTRGARDESPHLPVSYLLVQPARDTTGYRTKQIPLPAPPRVRAGGVRSFISDVCGRTLG